MEKSKDICTYYRLRGQEDNYGNTMIETSLRELMHNCLKNISIRRHYFKTMLCKMGECRYHIIINCTHKCHPKISGEFIEYSWGFAKNYYRQLSLDKNKGKKC